MGNFNFIETKIKDLYIIEPKVFGDNRGYFMESYNKNDFVEAGLTMEFVQDNESKSKKGVLRGMHFQTKHTQGKLVRVTEGAVYDVAVDLRKGSPTFGMWEGVLLTSFNYKCTDFYAPEYDSGLLWNDPDVGVEWPLEGIEEILLSEKDKKQKTLKELDLPFEYK